MRASIETLSPLNYVVRVELEAEVYCKGRAGPDSPGWVY
jgi:hypothetical protein